MSGLGQGLGRLAIGRAPLALFGAVLVCFQVQFKRILCQLTLWYQGKKIGLNSIESSPIIKVWANTLHKC